MPTRQPKATPAAAPMNWARFTGGCCCWSMLQAGQASRADGGRGAII
jgi:hypothetical protein